MMLAYNFVELNGRERIRALLDPGSMTEMITPFDDLMSPHLKQQGVVPQSDDGVIIVTGTLAGIPVLMISNEGKFQGGGIGEVSGAKITSALHQALASCQKGAPIIPIFLLDTGGVRLQEANYGLLSISEMSDAIVALKRYVPVIGVVPGPVGVFGGMSIVSALMSYLMATPRARVGLNGPEVIEQEAGVMEFDASDLALVWDTLGAYQREKVGVVDEVVPDDVQKIKEALLQVIREKKDVKRSQRQAFYLSLLHEYLEPSKKWSIEQYQEAYDQQKQVDHISSCPLVKVTSGHPNPLNHRGYLWFEALTGIKDPISTVSTVYAATKNDQDHRPVGYITIVPDKDNAYYRVRRGEVGLVEGFTVASVIEQWILEDQDQDWKRPIIAIVDVPSQAYGYNEELAGIHLSLAASTEAYAKARQLGHPVIALLVGNAISGAFLAHGLQANRLLAFDDDKVHVQAMSPKSIARVTKRTLEELEEAAKKIPAIAYDIRSFYRLGSVELFPENYRPDEISEVLMTQISDKLHHMYTHLHKHNETDLTYRYKTEPALKEGRKATNHVFDRMKQQWTMPRTP